MVKSIFSNLITITIVSLVVALIYWYTNLPNKIINEYFIPDIPSANEYYVHRVNQIRNLDKNKIKYFMAIPYGDNLVSKNNLWNMMRNCNLSKDYLPKSFILENFYDMEELKRSFHPAKIYILKKNIQRKKGITLFSGDLIELRRKYYDGGFKVIQEFITNPYLVNKRIAVLRLYLLITKRDEYKFYIHKYGKCLYAIKDFSLDNLEKDRLISDTRARLDSRYPKNLKDFCSKENIDVSDLHKPIETMIKCFRGFLNHTDDHSEHSRMKFFQLFGVDLILDEFKKPYLLEVNKSPDINTFYFKEDKEQKDNMVIDVRNLVENNKVSNFKIVNN